MTNVPPSPLNPVAIASGDFLSLALSATNLPPVAFPVHATGLTNQDLVLSLAGGDPKGDTLKFRNASLPSNGALYQFTANGRGGAISNPDTIISDPSGRIIFAPAPDGFGVPYATFSYASDDGENESAPVSVTVNLLTRPLIKSVGFQNSSLVLNFGGLSNVNYQVLGSTDLSSWVALGYASQPSPGQFRFLDASAINIPRRFYRVNVIKP